jgi:hypothetical protein
MPTWYCTAEDVTDALEERATAYDAAAIARAIAAGSDDVDDTCNLTGGVFRPELATKSFRWPPQQPGNPFTLYLDGNRLLSVNAITSGGVTIPTGSVLLEPAEYGPPYWRLEIDRSSADAFSAGDTDQQAIAVAGLWGIGDDRADAGILTAAINASVTTLGCSDASLIGVGDHLVIDAERLEVTGRTWATVTGGALTVDLTPSAAARSISVADGTLHRVGELLLIDSERLRVVDIAGNTLTALRAQDGSVLAAHTAGAAISAPRTLTVTRGVRGSTAASHLISAPIARHVVPPAAKSLAIASAVSTLLAERRGYAAQAGAGGVKMTPGDLDELRARVARLYGRQVRTRVI